MRHEPLPIDFFRRFQFLPLADQAVMHPFPEPCCCIRLVHSPQRGLQIQHVAIVHMAGMGAASKEVWILCMSCVSQRPATAAPGTEH